MLHDTFPISCNLNSQPLWCNICYPRCPNLVGMMSMLKVAANRYKQASIRAALLSNFTTNKRKAFRKLRSKKKSFPAFFQSQVVLSETEKLRNGTFRKDNWTKERNPFHNLSSILTFVSSHGDRAVWNVTFKP